MKALFCWWTFEGYLAACWRALAARPGMDVRVVALRPTSGSVAPFDASVLHGISAELHDRSAILSRDFWLARIREHQPDVIVVPGWLNAGLRAAVLHPALSDMPVVVASDRQWLGTLRQRVGGWRYRRYFARLDAFVGAGSSSAMLGYRLGVSAERIHTGMYGVDLDAFGRAFDGRATSDWPRSFLFVGRYVKQKGVTELAHAYQRYRQSVPDPWPLRCCGRGPLQGLLRDAGVEDLGFVSPADMPAVMSRSGVFVLPSIFEPWGLALVEASAAGLPLICTREIGSAEWLASPANATVVIPGDDRSLTQALLAAHARHADLPAMGAESRRLAASQGATAWAAHWEGLLQAAIQHRHRVLQRPRVTRSPARERGTLNRRLEHACGSIIRSLVRPPAVQVLCLHRLAFHQQSEVMRLITLLERSHEIVSYSEAVRRIHAGFDRPTIALTFDDGTADHGRIAELLAVRGVSACFFVCPTLLDAAGDTEQSSALCHTALRISPGPLLGWSELSRIASRGHEIGCHTRTHPSLASVDAGRLHDEIAEARAIFHARGVSCDHFAWPFGRFEHFTPEAASLVFQAGFVSCASAERGAHRRSLSRVTRMCIHRTVVGSEESADSVIVRLACQAVAAPVQADGWPDAWRARITEAPPPPRVG